MAVSGRQKNAIIITAVISVLAIIFILIFAVGEKYSEAWIIGKNRKEIEYRYGNFDLNFNNIAAYEMPEDPLDSVWSYYMGGDPARYYYIRFNENGVAEETYVGSYPGG